MHKLPLITFIVIILSLSKSYSQIQLPKGFNCVLGENHPNESYFSDGVYSFTSYPWGHDGIYGRDVINTIESNWDHKVKFTQTKDGLYWASGKIDGNYFYSILVDDALQYTLQSKKNGAQFSNYSTWLLQQIRNNKKSGLDTYYTDYKGKSCFGIR